MQRSIPNKSDKISDKSNDLPSHTPYCWKITLCIYYTVQKGHRTPIRSEEQSDCSIQIFPQNLHVIFLRHLISASTLVPKQVHSKNAKWRHIVNFRKIKTTPQFRRWFALITIYSPKALSEILFWMFTLIHLIVHYVTTEINDFLAFSCFFIAYKSQKINCFTKKDTKRQVWENASWHLIILWNAEVFLCKTCT